MHGDVRDYVDLRKSDYKPSYRSDRALQRWRLLNIDFREIFGVAAIFDFLQYRSKADLGSTSGVVKRAECVWL